MDFSRVTESQCIRHLSHRSGIAVASTPAHSKNANRLHIYVVFILITDVLGVYFKIWPPAYPSRMEEFIIRKVADTGLHETARDVTCVLSVGNIQSLTRRAYLWKVAHCVMASFSESTKALVARDWQDITEPWGEPWNVKWSKLIIIYLNLQTLYTWQLMY